MVALSVIGQVMNSLRETSVEDKLDEGASGERVLLAQVKRRGTARAISRFEI